MHFNSTILLKAHTDIASAFSSPFIEKRLSEIKGQKNKNAFLGSILADPNAVILNETNGHKTTLLPGNKGPKTSTWEQTKQMAFELNNNGIDVVFLPEPPYDISADSLIKIGNVFRIADFKYCITPKSNTLAKDLKHGFEQAKTIVLKLTKTDVGMISKALDYLLRNEILYGDIVLINKYGKTTTITRRDIKNKSYIKKLKGFL